MNKKTKKSEDLQNEQRAGDQGGSQDGEPTGTEGSVGGQGGRSEGGNQGSQGGSEGGLQNGGTRGQDGKAGGEDRDRRKESVLNKIRNKRSQGDQGQSSSSTSENRTDLQNNGSQQSGVTGDDKPSQRNDPGPFRIDGTDPRPNKQPDGSNSNSNDNRKNPETQGVKEKKGGVVIKPPAPPKDAAKVIDIKWDEVLSKKDAQEILPRFRSAIQTILMHMDSGIRITTKKEEGKHVVIWGNLDPGELDIIANHFVEMAQQSKIIATAVKKITNAHRLLQLSLIGLPRFLLTVNHYKKHGFTLPFFNFGGK